MTFTKTLDPPPVFPLFARSLRIEKAILQKYTWLKKKLPEKNFKNQCFPSKFTCNETQMKELILLKHIANQNTKQSILIQKTFFCLADSESFYFWASHGSLPRRRS